MRFELTSNYEISPKKEYESKSVEKTSIRNPYMYNEEGQSIRKSTDVNQKHSTSYKTASLRRRDHGQNMPMPVDIAKNRARNT